MIVQGIKELAYLNSAGRGIIRRHVEG
jgi:hypothetical protein